MLSEIRKLWKDESLMMEAVRKLGQMTADAEYVYLHAWEACKGQAHIEAIAPSLLEHDKAVNNAERAIRRMVVEHLNINPGKDVSGCLALMIMSKDIERVGDHSRNIFRIGVRIEGKIAEFAFFDRLDPVQERLGEALPMLQRAILDSSEQVAHEILERYQELKKTLKTLSKDLFTAELPSREMAATTFLVRFFTRINAHIGNATSGVIFPLENIDFVTRGLREEEEGR